MAVKVAAGCIASLMLMTVAVMPALADWKYTPQAGDSLWLLNQRFGPSVAELEGRNGLSGDTIYAGKALVVPSADFPRSADANPASVGAAAPANQTSTVQRQAAPASRIPYTQGDLDMLAHLVMAEAGSEPYQGQVGAAAVVINRVQSGRFPRSVGGVIFQTDAFESVSNGWYWNPAPASAYRAAQDALNGWDPSGGALFFFNPAKTSNAFMWARPVITQIGGHVFTR